MRIELTTLGLLDPRSNQLSYEGSQNDDKIDHFLQNLFKITHFGS